tara:strand:- start:2048 stop:2899 length:852 start_codon:yes stop_codon:yes gene_type:complete
VSKRNLVIDVSLCENCHNCTLATKDEHIGNNFPDYAAPQPERGHDWIKIRSRVRGGDTMVDAAYVPTMCNHCANAPCVKAAAGDGSIKQRDDGIVIIDPEKARGRKDLLQSCPYGAMSWNEELELPQIWIFDAHLLDQGWTEPRCQQSCPTGAIKMVTETDEKMWQRAEVEKLEVIQPELGTKPRVYYRNLHRFSRNFIGGTVVAKVDGVEDCVEGSLVTLLQDDRVLSEQRSDVFGNFKFDGLNAGDYRMLIAKELFTSHECDASINNESLYLGALTLESLS